MHVIAAKAVAFGEALQPRLQGLPGAGARQRAGDGEGAAGARPAHRLRRHRLPHVPGRPARRRRSPARTPRRRCGRAHITVNKNAIPNDPEKPFVTSGIRIGSPAMTTRGFTELESRGARAPDRRRARRAERRRDARASVRASVRALTQQVPGLRRSADRSRDGRRMKCPFCGSTDTQVIDSRVSEPGDSIRRRRRCVELPEALHHLRDGRAADAAGREDQRHPHRLRRRRSCASASQRALHKRPVPTEYVDAGGRPHRRSRCCRSGEREIPSRQIGEMVMQELYKLDKVGVHPLRLGVPQLPGRGRLPGRAQEVEAPAKRVRKQSRRERAGALSR